jgi:hypothetical protein
LIEDAESMCCCKTLKAQNIKARGPKGITMKSISGIICVVLVVFCLSLACQNNDTTAPSKTFELQYGLDTYTGVVDTGISGQHPDSGCDSCSDIEVGSSDTYGEQSMLLQYDISALILPATEVLSAELDLYKDTWGAADLETIDVYRINETWDSSTVTWNTRPSNVISHSIVSLAGVDRWITIQLNSQMVQEWVNDPSLNHGLLIAAPDSGSSPAYWGIASSDNPTQDYRPLLRIKVAK